MLVKQVLRFFCSYLVASWNVADTAHDGSNDEMLYQSNLPAQRTVEGNVELKSEH